MAQFNHSFHFCRDTPAQKCFSCGQSQQFWHSHHLNCDSLPDKWSVDDWLWFCQQIWEHRVLNQSYSAYSGLQLANQWEKALLLPGGLFLCGKCCVDNATYMSRKLNLPFFPEPIYQKGIFQ